MNNNFDFVRNRTLPKNTGLTGARVIDDWLMTLMHQDCYCKHITELNGAWLKLPSLPHAPTSA
jgi:hypothetical protein